MSNQVKEFNEYREKMNEVILSNNNLLNEALVEPGYQYIRGWSH